MKTRLHLKTCLSFLLAQSASAYIGGLNETANGGDGYDSTSGPNLNTYNAGEYGTANGGPGGSFSTIPTDSGLWKRVSGSSASITSGGGPTSFEGDGHINFLAGGSVGVDEIFSYDLDSRDFDGVAFTGTGEICLSFEVCPSKSSWSDSLAWLSFYDSNGTQGFSFGVDDTIVQYQGGGAAGYTSTGITFAWTSWNNVDLTFDFDTQTVEMAITPFGGATTTFTTALAAGFDGISQMQFGQHNYSAPTFAGADWSTYDDFNFTVHPVPEPSSTLLSLLGLSIVFVRKRR